jgi:hypothetical protein
MVVLPNMRPEVRSMLESASRQAGATTIDMTAALAALTAASGLSNHVSPRDAHLNRLALEVVAREIATSLAAPAAPYAAVLQ